MKTTAFGLAAAFAIGIASFAAPAFAAPASATIIPGITDAAKADVTQAYVVRRTIRRGPVCTVRTVVRRGPMGRRIVTKTRVCR